MLGEEARLFDLQGPALDREDMRSQLVLVKGELRCTLRVERHVGVACGGRMEGESRDDIGDSAAMVAVLPNFDVHDLPELREEGAQLARFVD